MAIPLQVSACSHLENITHPANANATASAHLGNAECRLLSSCQLASGLSICHKRSQCTTLSQLQGDKMTLLGVDPSSLAQVSSHCYRPTYLTGVLGTLTRLDSMILQMKTLLTQMGLDT